MVGSFTPFKSHSLSMMYFLTILITVFSVATTALPQSDSDIASLPPLDLPFPDSLPLDATTTANNNQNLMSDNPDQSLNFLGPSTFSSQIAQLPGANSVETSSILDPSTADTTAQTQMDGSIAMCAADGSTGQKVQKRGDWCPDALYFLRRPDLPKINYAHRTKEEADNDRKAANDKEWLDRIVNPNLPTEERVEKYLPLMEPGREWCKRHMETEFGKPYFANPLCCLGPREFITMPTLELRRVRRQQSVTLMNVYNCVLFLLGRPYCLWEEQRFCCHEVTIEFTDWGFKGLNCVEMGWNDYPTGRPLIRVRLNPFIQLNFLLTFARPHSRNLLPHWMGHWRKIIILCEWGFMADVSCPLLSVECCIDLVGLQI